MHTRTIITLLSMAFISVAGCTPESVEDAAQTEDGEFDDAFVNAFDSGGFTDCELLAVIHFVNNPVTTFDVLRDSGVHTRASRNIIEARNGIDGEAGTADDVLFDNIYALDDVPYVGPVAIDQLVAAGAAICVDGYEPPEPPPCAEGEVLDFVNHPSTELNMLKTIGVHTRGANGIIEERASGTIFASIDQLDDVPYVGPVTLERLSAHGETRCLASGVIMSPQLWEDSHLSAVVNLIDLSRDSVDIAIYSFRDGEIFSSLERARERGVSVRIIFESASKDRKDPEGTRSARLEDMGIEVRWINKIMHHKFAIIDGARQDKMVGAKLGTLVTGSGNWSNSAGTRFDENTLLLNGQARLNLLYQQEFNLLWGNSRPVEWNEEIAFFESVEITDDDINAFSGADAVFTSANFRTWESSSFGNTFSKDEGSAARDRLVELIASAQSSVWIASGHLRSRQVSEAIIAKGESNPAVDIRVYLDGQEYVSDWYYNTQLTDYNECMDEAADDADDIEDCNDQGLYFGSAIADAGLDIRYKYYAYRWDYSYADQMHHKYLLIDGATLATGSYNYSTNAEYNTMENIAILSGPEFQGIIDGYKANFEAIWDTERSTNTYDTLLKEIEDGTGSSFPIVFDAMSLNPTEILTLKDAIKTNCPEINSDDFRRHASSHRYCER